MARAKHAGDLNRAIVAAVGNVVTGVSIGRAADRRTWRIDYAPNATEAQRAQVDALLAAWSFDGLVDDAPKDDSATVRDLALMASELAKAKDELAQLKADMQAFVQAAVAAAVGTKA